MEGCDFLPGDAFCSVLPYAALVYNNSYMLASDSNASHSQDVFTQALSQYNCEGIPYSFVKTCDDCLAAYRVWVCKPRASAMGCAHGPLTTRLQAAPMVGRGLGRCVP